MAEKEQNQEEEKNQTEVKKQQEIEQEEEESKEKAEEIKLKDTVLLQKEQLEEQEDRLKRLMAEFDNFKKRSAKERENLYNSLISDIFSSLLPVIDNLEKAVETKTEDENSLEHRIYEFTKDMIEFRQEHEENNSTYSNGKIQYFKPDGSIASDNDNSYWNNPNANIVCYKENGSKPTFVSISSDANSFEIKLPEPENGKHWYKVCDTGIKNSFNPEGELTENSFYTKPYAVTIFEQR